MESDSDDYYSIGEFAEALEGLGTLAFKQLWLAADSRIQNANLDRAIYEPDELISAAIGASLKKGGKRWKKGVPIETHLWQAMRNIAYQWGKRQRPRRYLDSCVQENDLEDDDPIENTVSEQESTRESAEMEELLQAINAALKGDKISMEIIRLKMKEYSASDIQVALKISKNQYQASLRRIQRNKTLTTIHEQTKEDRRRA